MPVVPQPEAGRRVRAARAYAGIKSVPALKDRIGSRGFGRTTLYAIEAGRTAMRRPMALAIADACDLPVEFFEVDFARLPELVTDPGELFERELEEAVEPSQQRGDSNDEDGRARRQEGP